jgi:hypothetical protein
MFTFDEVWAQRRPDLVREQQARCQAEWFWITPPVRKINGLAVQKKAKKRKHR